MIGFGVYMKDYLPKDAENRFEIYGIHKSLGILALFLIFIRIINRIIKKPPSLPATIPNLDKKLSSLTHFLMYCLMITIPLSGYLMSNSFGYPVHFFSIQMPTLIGPNLDMAKIFSETHEISAFTLLFVVMLHVAGVVKHLFFDKHKNNLLKRML